MHLAQSSNSRWLNANFALSTLQQQSQNAIQARSVQTLHRVLSEGVLAQAEQDRFIGTNASTLAERFVHLVGERLHQVRHGGSFLR